MIENFMLQKPITEDDGELNKKADVGKPPLSLLPPEAMLEIAKVFGHGGRKYGIGNWRRHGVNGDGLDARNRYLSAAMRHIVSMMKLQDSDDESGLLHAAHAAACMMILIELRQASLVGVPSEV